MASNGNGSNGRDTPNAVLIVGGGVGGMRAAIDVAEAGLKAYLVESTPALGGRVAQLGFMFPTHDCVLCRGTSDHGFGCTRSFITPALFDHHAHPTTLLAKPEACDACRRCLEVCPSNAIDLEAGEAELEIGVGAVILAMGFQPFDPRQMPELGYGRFPNVITSMQYERLAPRSGPTEGIVRRLSDGAIPRRIAWLQCVGSRDQVNPYCSSICCMYATKQAILARQRIPDAECRIFTMDERAFNKEYELYY